MLASITIGHPQGSIEKDRFGTPRVRFWPQSLRALASAVSSTALPASASASYASLSPFGS
jgi:hypothetical protein